MEFWESLAQLINKAMDLEIGSELHTSSPDEGANQDAVQVKRHTNHWKVQLSHQSDKNVHEISEDAGQTEY